MQTKGEMRYQSSFSRQSNFYIKKKGELLKKFLCVLAVREKFARLVRHHVCRGNVTWVHLHETIMESGILDL